MARFRGAKPIVTVQGWPRCRATVGATIAPRTPCTASVTLISATTRSSRRRSSLSTRCPRVAASSMAHPSSETSATAVSIGAATRPAGRPARDPRARSTPRLLPAAVRHGGRRHVPPGPRARDRRLPSHPATPEARLHRSGDQQRGGDGADDRHHSDEDEPKDTDDPKLRQAHVHHPPPPPVTPEESVRERGRRCAGVARAAAGRGRPRRRSARRAPGGSRQTRPGAFSILAQVSRRPTVRFTTRRPAVVSGSTQK